jgi:hypothetical protein
VNPITARASGTNLPPMGNGGGLHPVAAPAMPAAAKGGRCGAGSMAHGSAPGCEREPWGRPTNLALENMLAIPVRLRGSTKTRVRKYLERLGHWVD